MIKIVLRATALTLILLVLTVAYFTIRFRQNLQATEPKMGNASIQLSALGEGGRVDYDSVGVPSIFAKNAQDAVRIQGYTVARDRLFQMDLIRRKMEGRLSELFGKALLKVDRESRFYGYSQVAEKVVENMGSQTKALLEAYAEGVNAWAKDHPSFEMLSLHYNFAPWQPKDSILVVLSMFESLDHAENESELAMNYIQKAFPKELSDFLALDYGFLDAPVFRDPHPLPIPKIPTETVFDLRKVEVKGKRSARNAFSDPDFAFGSNGFLVSAKRTKSGAPILAGDPHLSINVPNVWYRLQLNIGKRQITGSTFVGVPMAVIGTNGKIAWTFTNANADTVDFVPLNVNQDKKSYIVDGKEIPFGIREEKIYTKFGGTSDYKILTSEWGPVREIDGTYYAVQWAALDPKNISTIDLGILGNAETLSTAIQALKTWGGPVQNCFLASKDGHIAWVLVGNTPNRVGFDGRVSVPRDKDHEWRGYIPYEQMPKLIDPPEGYIANGNQRMVAVGKDLHRIANDFPSPARGYRIKELLANNKQVTIEDAENIQLDTMSHTHLWYRDILLNTLKKYKSDEWTTAISNLVQNWDGKLTVNSAEYVFLKWYRIQLFEALIAPLAEITGKKKAAEVYDFLDGNDAILSKILTERPAHLLPTTFKDYDELLVLVAKNTGKDLAKVPQKLSAMRWGMGNVSRYDHAFAKFFSPLKRWLSMPETELNGDSLVPRVEKPNKAGSLRMVVDFGQLEKSVYAMPGGQSGHPYSPNYKDQFQLWAKGQYGSLWPTKVASTTSFMP